MVLGILGSPKKQFLGSSSDSFFIVSSHNYIVLYVPGLITKFVPSHNVTCSFLSSTILCVFLIQPSPLWGACICAIHPVISSSSFLHITSFFMYLVLVQFVPCGSTSGSSQSSGTCGRSSGVDCSLYILELNTLESLSCGSQYTQLQRQSGNPGNGRHW